MKSALANELPLIAALLPGSGPQETLTRDICDTWDRAAFSNCSGESLRRYFSFHLEAICRMADRPQFEGRQEQLLSLIRYLREHYQAYLDENIRAPRLWPLQINCPVRIRILRERLNAMPLENSLISCLNLYLDAYLESGRNTRYTFGALHYLNELITCLEALAVQDDQMNAAIEEILDQFNFNHLAYLAHQQHKLKRKLNELKPTRHDAFLKSEQARVSARPEQSRYIYHPDWPSLKTMLLALIREELALAEPESCSVQRLPLNLSVAQLAFLIRLFDEQGLFATENLSQIFKFCAGHFSSKRQEQLSPGSLSKHFYSAGMVTAAVMRDKLTRMITHINREFFPK